MNEFEGINSVQYLNVGWKQAIDEEKKIHSFEKYIKREKKKKTKNGNKEVFFLRMVGSSLSPSL